MATIKSFTSLEQSRKLAEILPHESADMSWVSNGLGKPFARTIPIKGDPEELCGCWSLAVLLDILPDRTCVYKKTYKDGRVKYQGIAEGIKELILKDNPIDACYELILKLHELNIL